MNKRRNPLSNAPLGLILLVASFASSAASFAQDTGSPSRSCPAAAGAALPTGCYFWPGQGMCQGTGAHYCIKNRLVFDYPNESNSGGALFYAQVPSTYISCSGADCPAAGTPCSSVPLPVGQRPVSKVVQLKNTIKCPNF